MLIRDSDVPLNYQRQDNVLIKAFRDQLRRLPEFMYTIDRVIPNPYNWYKRWDNARTRDRYIHKVLEARFSQANSKDNSITGAKKQRSRAIIDLALESYLEQQGGSEKPSSTNQTMDAEFKKYATNQIKTFIFAGHDTTSSTICYVYYLLSKHPECLRKIREEHERVLGSVADTPERIREKPHLVNQLEYTLAVIKEILRLFPAASTLRKGAPE